MTELDFNIPFNPYRSSRIPNLTGKRFGEWLVYSIYGRKQNHAYWLCECSCGTWRPVLGTSLRCNNSTSCGCKQKENLSQRRTSHGQSSANITPVYRAYTSAKGRCNNPNMSNYKNYGGRGIKFSFDSFEEFYAEVGDRPSNKHSLDRIDNDRHYEVGNVRWATKQEQNTNQRSNRYITANGMSLMPCEWSKLNHIPLSTINSRLYQRKWCEECSVTLPPEQTPIGVVRCLHKI